MTQYPKLTVGRILSQEKGLYRVISEDGEQLAETSGKFRYEIQSGLRNDDKGKHTTTRRELFLLPNGEQSNR
jgi:hypothetical protein